MVKNRKRKKIPGIKYIPLPGTVNIFTDYGAPGSSAFPKDYMTKAKEKYKAKKEFGKQSDKVLKQTEINEKKALEIVKGGPGLGQTRRARRRAEKGAPVFVFDTENLGQPSAGKSIHEEEPLFAITQLSFSKFNNLNEMRTTKKPHVHNVVFQLPKDSEKKLREMVSGLEQDPLSYFDLSQREKESLADLVTMSDVDFFGKEVELDGKKYKTLSGQSESVRASMAILTSNKTISQMKAGIDNLSNEKLTTAPEEMIDLVSYLKKGGAIGIGHNPEKHDQLGLEQHLRKVNAPEEIITLAREEMIDTLALSNHVVNKQSGMESNRNTLSALYNNITDKPHGDVMAHNAEDDVLMNIAVGNKLLEKTVIGKNNESELIYPGDMFQVDVGINFYPNEFTKNDGQYDMVTKINPNTGKHELQYKDLQRGTGRGSRVLKYMGATDSMEIDGVQHIGIQFYNEEEDAYHSFYRRTQSAIDDIFNQNLVKAGEMSEEKSEYIKLDRARRRYLDLFTDKTKTHKDTVSNRLELTYSIIDTYEELESVFGEELTESELIKETLKVINENKENKDFPYGLSRIEDTIYIKDKLKEDRPMLETIVKSAQSHAGVGATPIVKAKRENIYMNEVFNKFIEGAEEAQYGYDGMEMLKLEPLVTVGSESHRNIESKGRLKGFIRTEFNKDIERVADGKTPVHIERMFSILGDSITDKQKESIQEELYHDYTTGKVTPGVVDRVANLFDKRRGYLKKQGHIVSSVPGIDIENPLGQHLMNNESKEELGAILKEAREVTDARVAKASGMIDKALNQKSFKRVINKSDSIDDLFKEGIIETNKRVSGVDSGYNLFKEEDTNEKIERLLKSFTNRGHQVRLEQVKDTNKIMLFATPDKNINISDLSFGELNSHESIFGEVLPLYNEDFSINTSFGNVRNISKAKIHKLWDKDFDIDNINLNDIEITGTADRIFEEIAKTPALINRSLKKGHTIEDSIKKSSSRMTRIVADSGVPAGFRSFTSEDIGYESSSKDKNRMGLIDMNDYRIAYAKTYREDEYRRFIAGRNSGGSDNFYDYLDSRKGDAAIFELEMKAHYQEKIGDKANLNIYADGRNPTQISRGLWVMTPSTILNPTSAHHRQSREQGTKTPNYRAINREILEAHLSDEYGEGSLQAKMTADPAQSFFSNMPGREEEISAYEIEIARIGDAQLAQATEKVKKRVREEREELVSKPGDLTLLEQERLEKLDRMLNIATLSPSTFEDGYLLSEKFAKNIKGDEYLELGLEGYDLDENLEKHLKGMLHLDEGEEFSEGKHVFDQELSMSQLEKIGVADEHGYLTIGKLQAQFTRANEGSAFTEYRKKRLQTDASLYGIVVDEHGQKELLIKNPSVAKSGFKTLDASSGARETGFFVPQEYIDMQKEELGLEGDIKAIKAFEKMGVGQRGATASAYSDAVRTSARNIGKSIEELHNTGETELDAVNEFFVDGLGETPLDDYQRYIEEKFIGEVNKATNTEYLKAIDKSEGVNNYEFSAIRMEGTPVERQQALKNLFGLATNKYGLKMDEESAVVSSAFKVHNIDTWAGTGVKAKFGRKELNILSQITRGPTREQQEQIRSLGEVAGDDYSDFSFDLKLPGESIIEQNYKYLSKVGNVGPGATYEDIKRIGLDRREQENYARSVRSAVEQAKEGIIEEDIQLGGNIIVDAAGSYTFKEGSNILTIGEGDDKYHVIDGQSVRLTPSGMPSGAEFKGSYGNLESVNVYSDEIETTIGDLAKDQNSKVYVKLMDNENALADEAMLENNVVEAIPMLSGKRYGKTFQLEAERAQTRMFEAAHKLSYEVPDGRLDKEAWVESNLIQMFKGNKDFKEAAGRFLGSTATKSYEEIVKDNSMSFYLSGRNILNTEYRAQDIVMGERQARIMIEGQVETILAANKVLDSDIISYSGLDSDEFNKLSRRRQDKIREDYIVEQLKGVKDEDNDFELFIMGNRQPTQDEGSIIGASLRIDETGEFDGRIASIDPRLAARMGGDFDGDAGYLSTYPYLHYETPERAVKLQEEMKQLTKMTTGLAIVDNHDKMIADAMREGKNSYLEILEMTEKANIDSVFADNISDVQSLLQIISDDSMQVLVGSTYHSVDAVNDAIRYTTDIASMSDSSEDNLDKQRTIMSETSSLLSKVQEESISKKKMGIDQVLKYQGFTEEEINPEKIIELFETGDLTEYSQQFTEARNQLPHDIRNISEQSAPRLHEELIRLDILKYKNTEEGIKEQKKNLDTFIQIGRRNDAWGATPYASFSNIGLKHGDSSADENKQNIINTIINKPEIVPYTEQLQSMAEQQIGDQPEVIEAWKEATMKTNESILESIDLLEKKAQNAGPTFEQSNNLLKQISQSETSTHMIRSQSDAFNMVAEGVTSMMGSNHFKAAAGIAAGWTAARVMSKGPTPEGNLAEREQATPQEIAPSQMLTSPTARVAPGAESINLNISGQGNLTEAEAATVVNNEIGAMTGTTMNMNIVKKDNTAKLDNRFYQKAVEGVFGF